DDAERAIRAGLELIKCIGKLGTDPEQLKVRIGIATGTVIVGELVASAAADHPPVVGVTPNLAARLQAIAEPNTVVIGPSTRRLPGGLFEYAELGQRNLKGFSQPIPVWQVLGESTGSSRFEALRSAKEPIVGREEELGTLQRLWAQAVGGEGSVVLLSGEP